MEIRLAREVEKSKSVLYKTRSSMATQMPPAGFDEESASAVAGSSGQTFSRPEAMQAAQIDDLENESPEQKLSPEQMQLFKQENQDLLKHYENSLDQVR